MAETRFVSLADVVRTRPSPMPVDLLIAADETRLPAVAECDPPAKPVRALPTEPVAAAPAFNEPADALVRAAIREARLFRAALGEAFAERLAGLLGDFAIDVLGRELRLAPADLDALARRLIVERAGQEPLRLRVAAADAHVVCDLPVVVDTALQSGDAILDCRMGSIDARLAIRLAGFLAVVNQ